MQGMIEVVPQSSDVIQQSRVVDNDKLVIVYLHDVKHSARLYHLATHTPLTPSTLPLSQGSVISSITSRKHTSHLFYQSLSYLTPGLITQFDFKTMQSSVFKKTKIVGYDESLYETQQVMYESKDGTKIPMYIVSKKGAVLDGKNPTLLYGYGGFNISILPQFSVTW
jgi:prolyl oligopeptidase